MKNSRGKVWISDDSAGKVQFPCGKKRLWNKVNTALNKSKDINRIEAVTRTELIPAYLSNLLVKGLSL